MIKRLSPHLAYQAAQLHLQCLPDDFLASIGIEFLSLLYTIFSKTTYIHAYIWIKKRKVVGLIIGTNNTNSFFRTILVTYWSQLVPVLIKKIFFNPLLIFKLFETALYTKKSKGTISAELLVICIDPAYQRKGIGSHLINQLKQSFKKEKVTQFKVSTHTSNKGAQKFYHAAGGRPQQQFMHYGKVWQTYIIQTK